MTPRTILTIYNLAATSSRQTIRDGRTVRSLQRRRLVAQVKRESGQQWSFILTHRGLVLVQAARSFGPASILEALK